MFPLKQCLTFPLVSCVCGCSHWSSVSHCLWCLVCVYVPTEAVSHISLGVLCVWMFPLKQCLTLPLVSCVCVCSHWSNVSHYFGVLCVWMLIIFRRTFCPFWLYVIDCSLTASDVCCMSDVSCFLIVYTFNGYGRLFAWSVSRSRYNNLHFMPWNVVLLFWFYLEHQY